MKKILMLSNMYPSVAHPSYGVFVKNFEDSLVDNGIPFEKIVMLKENRKLFKLFNYLFFFIKVFMNILLKEYSVVYIHYASITSIPVLWASKLKKIIIYTNVHGTDVVPVKTKEKKLEANTKKILKLSSKVIVPSAYFKELVKEKYLINDENIIVYPSGGIDETIFFPKKNKELKTNKWKSENKITLGYVSRIEKDKGWKVLLDAMDILSKIKEISDFKLIMVGDGSEKKELEAYSKCIGLEKIIDFYPLVNQKELNDLYNEMDLFIFPTKKESLGLVGIEAMASGVPVLGSDIPPLASYITPYKNGLLFESGNSEDLARNIYKFSIMSDTGIERLKEESLKTSKSYRRENIKKKFIKIFK